LLLLPRGFFIAGQRHSCCLRSPPPRPWRPGLLPCFPSRQVILFQSCRFSHCCLGMS
jgi:hypothetical protein